MLSKNSNVKSNKGILVITMLFIVTSSSALTLSFPVFIMQIFLASITLPMILSKDYKTAKLYVIIFTISLAFVFLIFLANKLYYGTPYYIGGSDDLKFEAEGEIIKNAAVFDPSKILESGIIGIGNNAPIFAVYISILIEFSERLGGYSTFLPRIMNVYYLIWIGLIFQYLLKKYANFTNEKNYITLLVFALTPNIQFINSHVFRDTLNLLQIMLIIFVFDKFLSNEKYGRKVFYVGILAFLIYVTYYNRINSLVFASGICLLTLADKTKIKKKYVILASIPLVIMSNFLDAIKIDYFIENYTTYVLNIAGDGLSRYVFMQPLLPFGIIIRAFYAFVTPFPNFFGIFNDPTKLLLDTIMFMVYLGVGVQVLAIPFIIKRLLKYDWLSLTFLILFLGIIVTTFTFRHILFYYPFMVGAGVDGYMSLTKRTRKKILFSTGIICLFLALIYFSLKLIN